jgi:phosphoglycolate phosphatase-like HAD superfamily hydrolase
MKYKHIIFDFDGVLAETNDIRFDGFRSLFKNHNEDLVNTLIKYARLNGGKSRYDKIRYFFENIINEAISKDKIYELALQYSQLVKQKVIDALPVRGSTEFLSQYQKEFCFAIVSGSDQDELRDVCKARGIDHFFIEILGSPLSKSLNISQLLPKKGWKKELCVYIGDSPDDLEAAKMNGIDFIGRNSGLVDWQTIKNVIFITDMVQLPMCLK